MPLPKFLKLNSGAAIVFPSFAVLSSPSLLSVISKEVEDFSYSVPSSFTLQLYWFYWEMVVFPFDPFPFS